jgi:hypothetical protein
MWTKKATRRERELRLSRGGAKKNRLVIISAVIVVAAVLLSATSCTTNYRPIITSLEAEAPGWTAPLGSLQVTCNASDPEGDELSYNWSASGGNITGTGAVVNWTAPGEVGMYDITIAVDDGTGRWTTGSITVTSSNGPPPVIQDLIVTAVGHPYLKKTATGYKVGEGKECYLECVASGNSTLSYNWTCTGGNISGEGSAINWTAPNTEAYVTVTVKVFDGLGNWIKKSIVFQVVECLSCNFG